MHETEVRSLGQEDPLEKEMTTTPVLSPGEFHAQRSLAEYSPWTEEPGGIHSMKLQRVRHDLATKQQ